MGQIAYIIKLAAQLFIIDFETDSGLIVLRRGCVADQD